LNPHEKNRAKAGNSVDIKKAGIGQLFVKSMNARQVYPETCADSTHGSQKAQYGSETS
jgi:hypothetical protein